MEDGEAGERSAVAYPATPAPFVVRREPPGARAPKPPTGRAPGQLSTRGVFTVFGSLVLGVALMAVGARAPVRPWWHSSAAPLIPILAVLALQARAVRTQRSIRDASERALDDPTATLVALRPCWTGSARRPRCLLPVLAQPDDRLLGAVSLRIDPAHFDPRGTFWLHGSTEPGGAVALRPTDDRPPMLTTGAFVASERVDLGSVHPCSDVVNATLGWTGDRAGASAPVPGRIVVVPSTSPADRDPDLEAAARSAADAGARVVGLRLLALVLLVPAAALLRLSPVASVALTIVVWSAGWAVVRWGWPAWIRPLVAAIRARHALGPDDAAFVARALLAGGFGVQYDSSRSGSGPDAPTKEG